MPYVARTDGKITAIYLDLQPNVAEELVEWDDAEVLLYLNPPPPAPTIECPTCLGTGRVPLEE